MTDGESPVWFKVNRGVLQRTYVLNSFGVRTSSGDISLQRTRAKCGDPSSDPELFRPSVHPHCTTGADTGCRTCVTPRGCCLPRGGGRLPPVGS